MSRVDLSSAGFSKASLPNGMLQTDSALNTTLQTVKDNVGNSSTLLLSTVDAQFNSTLRIHTDSSELLDIEDTGANNRFNINRVVQQINLDFASKPTDLTTIVGAIRTAQDGVNLSNALYFRENGQATFTERLGIESDSTVATQTSSVIQATTTNANLVLNPNGTGAIVAQIPDGTATGGNARGQYALDLQLGRGFNSEVASGSYSIALGYGNSAFGTNSIAIGNRNTASNQGSTAIGGGGGAGQGVNATANYSTAIGGLQNNAQGQYSGVFSGFVNTASSNYSTVSGGQSNTASTNTHATVVGGYSNVASGQYSVAGSQNCTSSGSNTVAIGWANGVSGAFSCAFGAQNSGSATANSLFGYYGLATIYGQLVQSSNRFTSQGDAQISNIISRISSTLSSSSTAILYADGVSATILPSGTNRAWNVQVNWIAVVTAITGTATGVTVGDTITQVQTLGFKRVSTASSLVGTANTLSTNSDTSMSTASMTYTAGTSQELKLTFTAPTFVGGGTVTCRVVARIELTEVAW